MDTKISIIITIDSSLKALDRSLDSICGQSLQGLEVICIDEGLDDLSKMRIQRYASLYDWVKLVQGPDVYEKRLLKWLGLSVATGEYVLFLDTNTYFETKALEIFYKKATAVDADIFQFHMRVFPQQGITKAKCQQFEQSLKLKPNLANAEEILQQCYIQHTISVGFQDKLFRTNILREAFSDVEALFPSPYETEILFFVAMQKSQIYYGDPGRYGANYILYPTSSWLDQEAFNKIAGQVEIWKHICRFLHIKGIENSYQKITSQIRLDLLKNALTVWTGSYLEEDKKVPAFDILLQNWGAENIICGLAQWFSKDKISYMRFLPDVFSRKNLNMPPRCTAILSGVEWANQLAQKALPVIQLTYKQEDVENTEHPVILLPSKSEISEFWYHDRYETLCRVIKQYSIDLIIFDWCREQDLWEILTAKSCGVRICIDASKLITLSALYQQNDTISYLRNLSVLMQSDAALLPEDADTYFFEQFGIQGLSPEASIEEIFLAAGKDLIRCWDAKTCAYEQWLLANKYRQELFLCEREISRFRRVVGPLKPVLFRPVNIPVVQAGIRIALFWEMFSEASLIGKGKLMLKLLFRLFGGKCSLGIQNYHPKPKISLHARCRKWASVFCCLLTHPQKFCQQLKIKREWKLSQEKRFSLGTENQDKTFYLIRLKPGTEGLMASYLYFLRVLRQLEKTNYIPIIDMRWAFYVGAHNSPKDKGRVNSWELYFQPVSGYSLEDVCHSQNVIRGKLGYREQVDRFFSQNVLKENTVEAEKEFAEWCRLDHKYMRLQPALEECFAKEYESEIGSNRVIGVMVREGYVILNQLNYELISNHPVQPEFDQLIDDIRKRMKEWDCNKVFISAEYQQTIDIMQAAFSDQLYFVQRDRKNFSADTPDEYRNKREKYYKHLMREQINRDYLKEIYFLSRCTCLLSGRANATIVAALWNRGKYEHRYIYDLGTYSIDKEKPVVTLDSKQ